MTKTKPYDEEDPLNTLDAENLKVIFGLSKSKNALKQALNPDVYSEVRIILDKEWAICGKEVSVFQLGFKRREQLVKDALFYAEKINIDSDERLDILQTLNSLGFKDHGGYFIKKLVVGEEVVFPDLTNREIYYELL